MSLLYRLEGHQPVAMDDALAWARWMEEHRETRTVRRTEVGPLVVSTVFLGVDPAVGQVPELFETVVYRSATEADREECRRVAAMLEMEVVECPEKVIERMVRTATWEEAEGEHKAMVRWAREQTWN